MEILKYILENEKLHGKNADNSLEYIGITVNKSDIKKKLYQTPFENNSNDIINLPPYNTVIDKYLSHFIAEKGVTVCDYSESNVDGIHTYRIVFKFPRYFVFEDSKRCIDAFFCNLNMDSIKKELEDNIQKITDILNFEYSPLLQIGLEFDADSQILGVKYYLNLKVSSYQKVKASDDFLLKIQSVFKSENGTTDDDLYRVVQTSEFDYSPIFVGVNVYKDSREYKIYMISGYLGHDDNKLLNTTLEMIKKNGWNSVVSDETLRKVHAKDLFIEGIAYTLNKPDEYRLYFNYLPRKR